jgi:hypothetical protein
MVVATSHTVSLKHCSASTIATVVSAAAAAAVDSAVLLLTVLLQVLS